MKWGLYIILIFLSQAGIAQSIDLQLISSAGSGNDNNQIAWSLGESATQGGAQLTQGFHQGNLLLTPTFENQPEEKFRVYPNPSRDQLIVEVSNNIISEVELIDVEGKLLRNYLVSEKVLVIDLENLYPGLYFVRFKGNNKIPSTHKIIKIR